MDSPVSIIGKRCATVNEIKALVNHIVEKFDPERVILFGSYASGKPTPESDVDLCIVIDSDRSTWELSAEIALSIDHVFPIDIVVKTNDEIKRRLKSGDFFIADIIEKGKILYERSGQGVD